MQRYTQPKSVLDVKYSLFCLVSSFLLTKLLKVIKNLPVLISWALKLLKDREEQERKLVAAKSVQDKQQEVNNGPVIPKLNFENLESSKLTGNNMSQQDMLRVLDDMIGVIEQLKQNINVNIDKNQ